MKYMNYFRYMVMIMLPALMVAACDKSHSFTQRPFPLLIKTEITDAGPEGARFRGEILEEGTDPVTDHGFYWGFHETLPPGLSQVVHLGPMENASDFESFVDFGMPAGKTLYVKAFAICGDLTVYSPVDQFVSQGCHTPEITAITPSPATYKQEISIQGKYFGSNDRLVDVTLYTDIQKTYFSDTLIKIEVPVQLTTKINEVTVDVMGMKATGTLELYPPVVSHISPGQVALKDTLDVYGDYLKPYPYFQDVLIGDTKCQVISPEKEHLRVLVNPLIETGKYYHVKVIIGDMSSVSPDSVYVGGQ